MCPVKYEVKFYEVPGHRVTERRETVYSPDFSLNTPMTDSDLTLDIPAGAKGLSTYYYRAVPAR